MFHNFPEETQHALTFTPKDGEWTARIELWEKPLRDALPPDMYMEAMAILCDWVLRCMKRRADMDEETAEQEDKALVLDALRAVLKDPEATSAQRLYAVAVLDRMKYYNFVPHDMRHSDALIADFARRLENDTE